MGKEEGFPQELPELRACCAALQPFRAPTIDSKDQRSTFGLPVSWASTQLQTRDHSKLSTVQFQTLNISKHRSILHSITPAKHSSLRPPVHCHLGLSPTGTFKLLNGLKTGIWNPNFVEHHWKNKEGHGCRNLKHILTSTIKIHVQSLGLYSSISSSRGSSDNSSCFSFFLLGTNTKTPPKSIHFTIECKHLGAMLTLLAQVGSSKERQSCLSATYTHCCFFNPHCKSYSTPEHLDLSSQHTTSRLVGFAHAHGCSQGWTKAKALVLFPEPFSISDSQQQIPCSPFKGWSIFHSLKLPHLQGAGGNKTVFDLAKGKISEVKGQSEEFIIAAKAAKTQAPDQNLPSFSACHVVQLSMCLEGAGCCREHSQKTPISYTHECTDTRTRPLHSIKLEA